MGNERKVFSTVLDLPVSDVPHEDVSRFLFEIMSGIVSFKDATNEVDTWVGWFKYLVPGLVLRGNDYRAFHFLIEDLISTFFRVYANGVECEGILFKQIALDSIGQAIMMPQLWDDKGESICAQYQDWGDLGSGWPSCSGAISASLFFCLSYLDTNQIASWTESILGIKSNYFRAHFLSWLAGAHNALDSAEAPFSEVEKASFEIGWEHSVFLKDSPTTLPLANRLEFLTSIRRSLTVELVYDWLDGIARYDDLSLPLQSAKTVEYVVDKMLV